MKKFKKKQLTMDQKNMVLAISSSVLTLAVLAFSLLSIHAFMINERTKLYFALTFLFLSLSRIPLFMKYKIIEDNKVAYFKNIVFSIIYFVLCILTLSLPSHPTVLCVMCSIFFLTLGVNRVCAMFEKKTVASFLFNGFLAFGAVIFTVGPLMGLGDDTVAIASLAAASMIILVISMIDTLTFAFSRIKLKGIIKIIRRTFALEVLYGLVVLVIASSFYFALLEESIGSFEDGMWYSFMIITTIGLGDFTVKSTIGRILSIILGMYGLIVVAVLTSIIVNYYNDTKDKKDNQKEDENKETEDTTSSNEDKQD